MPAPRGRAVSCGAALILDDVFGANGALAERLPGFTYRAAQQQMAELVVAALESGRHAVIEAGTGIGKTFAYLLPAAVARAARHHLDRHAHVAGPIVRSRLAAARRHRRPADAGRRAQGPQQLFVLAPARRGVARRHARCDDDRARSQALDAWGQDERQRRSHGARGSRPTIIALRGQVTSTVDNCLGRECEFVDRCFVAEARRRAQAAEVVIVNHHLLLADLVAEGFGVRRAVAGHRCRDRRRGASAARRRAAVLRLVGRHARARIVGARRIRRGARRRRAGAASMRR